MRVALLSDVHGNRPALDAVLQDVDRRNDVDALYHLGDLVGYGPFPNEVVSRMRDRSIMGVSGNYDSTVANHYRNCGCRYENAEQEMLSHRSYGWTLRHVTGESVAFLRALPFRMDLKTRGGHVAGPRLVLVHAHTSNNLIYVEESRSPEFLQKMAESAVLLPGDAIAFGHTHKPWHRSVADVHFVNTGSVGRPKDGDWRAGYALLDIGDETVTVEFIRVEYDVDETASAILQSDLPDEFASFLRTGGAVATTAHR